VLQNKGGDNRAVAASGSFAFSTNLADGAAYSVTVLTQPAFQNCTVSNGSGTVAAASVTNVAVTCTTPSVTLGGSVSGLVGLAGLVLQNNGGSDLAVAVNGSFSFGTMPSGSAYSVTVLSPNFSRDNCAVGNGSGLVPKDNVSNITVSCIAPYAGYEIVSSIATRAQSVQWEQFPRFVPAQRAFLLVATDRRTAARCGGFSGAGPLMQVEH
jgi:hypothetical protein